MSRGLWALGAAASLFSACVTEPAPSCEAFGVVRALGETTHTFSCTAACGNGLNPPTAGAHCATTLSCRVFDTAQPRCSWIHNLEHGHLVLAYNCPEGCPDELEQLRALYDAASAPKRVLLTPDPELPTRFAAIVWGTGWSSDTLDLDAIACVQGLQDAEAPEPGIGCAP